MRALAQIEGVHRNFDKLPLTGTRKDTEKYTEKIQNIVERYRTSSKEIGQSLAKPDPVEERRLAGGVVAPVLVSCSALFLIPCETCLRESACGDATIKVACVRRDDGGH